MYIRFEYPHLIQYMKEGEQKGGEGEGEEEIVNLVYISSTHSA